MLSAFRKKAAACMTAVLLVLAPAVVSGAETVTMKLFYDGTSHSYSAQEIHITVNGESIQPSNMPPVILSDRTLVPARDIFEKLGAEVDWNADTKEVYVVREADVVVLTIGSQTGMKNGVEFSMEVGPKIINDSTMIPVRSVAEVLGCQVDWVADTRTVVITEEKAEEPALPSPPEVQPQPEPEPEVPVVPETPAPPSENTNSGQQQTPSGQTITVSNVTRSVNGGFLIVANGPIEKYEAIDVEGNRLAVDIYNAVMGISDPNMTLAEGGNVAAIRSAQNQMEPQKITRVVFDLKALSPYSLNLSEDKKSLEVIFSKTKLTNLAVATNADSDTLSITGTYTPTVTAKTTGSNQIVLEVKNAESALPANYPLPNSKFINSVQTVQNGDTVQITLGVKANSELEISYNGNRCDVKITGSTVENIYYDTANKTVVIIKPAGLYAADIQQTDNYLQKEYVLRFLGNYQNNLGYGTLKINDGSLQSLYLETQNNQTVMTIREEKVFAYNISEDGEKIYIKAVNPKEKYDKVVVIDPGHGGGAPGAIVNGVMEKDLTLQIGMKVYQKLEADPNIKVYMTRMSDITVENRDRPALGNQVADLFVSIHQNSVEGSTKPNGSEVWYLNHGQDGGKLTSEIAAQTILNHIVDAVGTTDRGIKVDPDLIVLNQSVIPSVLIECGFMTNPGDMAKISGEETQNLYANAIYSAIVDMFNKYPVR